MALGIMSLTFAQKWIIMTFSLAERGEMEFIDSHKVEDGTNLL